MEHTGEIMSNYKQTCSWFMHCFGDSKLSKTGERPHAGQEKT